jgi:hypothetical protein
MRSKHLYQRQDRRTGSSGDAIGKRRKFLRESAPLQQAALHALSRLSKTRIAPSELGPRGADPNNWFAVKFAIGTEQSVAGVYRSSCPSSTGCQLDSNTIKS